MKRTTPMFSAEYVEKNLVRTLFFLFIFSILRIRFPVDFPRHHSVKSNSLFEKLDEFTNSSFVYLVAFLRLIIVVPFRCLVRRDELRDTEKRFVSFLTLKNLRFILFSVDLFSTMFSFDRQNQFDFLVDENSEKNFDV